MAESGNLGGRNVRYRWQKGKPLRWQKGKAEVAEKQSLGGRKADPMWQKGKAEVR